MIFVPEEPTLERPPRIRNIGRAAGANCADAEFGIELANRYVISLYDWQEDILRCWLARGDDGKYACQTDGLIIPRQNGKTKGVLVARMLIGAIFYGERIRFSAHRVDTMTETFEAMLDIVGDPRLPSYTWQYPEIASLVSKRSCKNGDLKIKFFNGAVIYFVARSKGSGRGYSVDANIYDEAQFLSSAELASSLPAQSASPSGNPVVIYAGTPPDFKECDGEVLGNVRKNALAGSESICWHEWSVGEMPDDIRDRSIWYATNPSLGKSLIESSVANESVNMPPESFAIERLGLWLSAASESIVDMERWRNLSVDSAPPDELVEKMALGVKFTPDGIAAVAIALKTANGTHVELVMNVSVDDGGMTEIINRISSAKDKVAYVAIDGKTGGGELEQRLIAAGISRKALGQMRSSEVVTAATMFMNAIAEKTMTHYEDDVLNASVESATKRKIGQDGYGFGGDSAAIEAAAAANWAVITTKRNPARKVRLL